MTPTIEDAQLDDPTGLTSQQGQPTSEVEQHDEEAKYGGNDAIQLDGQQVQGNKHLAKDDNMVYLDEKDLCGDNGLYTLPFTKGLPCEPANQATLRVEQAINGDT